MPFKKTRVPGEPLNLFATSLRELKRAAARRRSKLMAQVLNKICNKADVRFRSRPAELTGNTPLFVATFRQAGACLQRGAAIDELPVSQRGRKQVQRIPKYLIMEDSHPPVGRRWISWLALIFLLGTLTVLMIF